MKTNRKRSLSLVLFTLPLFAAAQLSSYSWKRPVAKTGKDGYYGVRLTPEVMAMTLSDLRDLRIYQVGEKDTIEQPYIHQWMGRKSEQLKVPFELINSANDQDLSYVTLKFGSPKVIDEIRLEVAESNFDKVLEVQGSSDNQKWVTVRRHVRIVGFSNGDGEYRYTTLNFSPSEYPYFRLVLSDKSSKPVTITNAFAYQTRTVAGNYSELAIASHETKEDKEKKATEHLLSFSMPYKLSRLELKAEKGKDFYRNVNVYYLASITKAPKGDIENWEIVNTTILASTEDCIIECYNTGTKKIKIEVLNNDDQPVKIDTVKVFAEDCQLFAKLPASDKLILAYGKEGDDGPRYDMAHFASNYLPLAKLDLGKEEKIEKSLPPPAEALLKDKLWLWVVMGVLIVVIGAFSFRMLKNPG